MGVGNVTLHGKKKSTKEKREPASCPGLFHGHSLPSCFLEAPMRIPKETGLLSFKNSVHQMPASFQKG